ncbi:MAG: ureidoglycolate lyase [Gaiellaceae bacterium]
MSTTDRSSAEVRTVAVEPMSEEAFAPFGDMIAVRGEPLPHVYGDTMDVYEAGFHECDVETEFIVTRYRLREPRVLYLERHHQITQTFIPMMGDPFIVAVAAPDAPLENGLPVLDSVRAFVVPGDAAAKLHRGTWHEVPLPLVDDSLVLLTSHHGVTSGWAELDDSNEINKEDTDEEKRDVTERSGVVLELDIPAEYEGGAR